MDTLAETPDGNSSSISEINEEHELGNEMGRSDSGTTIDSL